MRAAIFTEFGPPEVVRVASVPPPDAGSGEVIVRIAAATLNPTDTLMRAGKQAALMKDLPPPWIAGVEFAGTIHSLGPDVDGLATGDSVMGLVSARRQGGGAHAELVRVPAASLARLMADVDPVTAATVPMNGLTALMAIEQLALPAGSTVLVTGGPGAVGGYAIQLARQAGFAVIADAAPADADLLRSLGATQIVPRGDSMADAVRALRPSGVDGLIDAALIGATAARLVRDRGSAVAVRRSHLFDDPRLRSSLVSVFERAQDRAALERLADALTDGSLTPRVARATALADAVEAHRLVERGGLRGRIVLVP